jgi:hypothetical protein
MKELTKHGVMGRGLLTFYEQNKAVYTIVVKSFMSEFLINLITNAQFVKLLILIVILL